MKILALDYGDVRVGVSVGDTNTEIAFTRNFLSNDKTLIEEIKIICVKENIERVIIGNPIMLDGSESESSIQINDFIKNLKKKINIEIELINEQFTTNIAQNRLNKGICKNKNKKQKIDSASAQVLLENYFRKK